MKPLVLVGDEAWTPEEWEMRKRRLARRRAQWRDSKRRAKLRDERPEPVGYLHSLGCPGPANHRRKPSCIPIPCYVRKG